MDETEMDELDTDIPVELFYDTDGLYLHAYSINTKWLFKWSTNFVLLQQMTLILKNSWEIVIKQLQKHKI